MCANLCVHSTANLVEDGEAISVFGFYVFAARVQF